MSSIQDKIQQKATWIYSSDTVSTKKMCCYGWSEGNKGIIGNAFMIKLELSGAGGLEDFQCGNITLARK